MTIADNYQRLLEQIETIAQRVGRRPAEICLVAASKGRLLSQILEAYEAGCRHFGENRLQELQDKQPEAPKDIQWHFIGTLQRNKVRSALASGLELIHAVDTLPLAEKVALIEGQEQVKTPILIQVNISGEKSKHGFSPEGCRAVFEVLPALPIVGLMTMAPECADERTIRSCFIQLRQLRDSLTTPERPLYHLSMGMSEDFPIAIEEGATLLRLGSALFDMP